MQQSIVTLGQQRAVVDGQVVHWTAPAAQRLFYLMLTHPDGSTRNTLIQKMGVTESSFRVIQHRLRYALGRQDAITENEGRYFLATSYYQNVDYLLFQEALRQAKRAEDRENRLRFLYRAISLYTGDFLPDYTDDWAEEIRTTLQATYVQTRLEVASLHCVAVECQSAVRNLANGLAAEPLVGEQFHRNLMDCLCNLDRPDDATLHYRRFLGFLQSEVGDTPTHATTQLAVHIRDGQPHQARSIGVSIPCQRQLLYGSPLPDEPLQQLNFIALENEVRRSKQMLTLIRKVMGARDWMSLMGHVEHFLNVHIGKTYIWLIPNQSLVRSDRKFDMDLSKTDWPAAVISAFQTTTQATQSGTALEEVHDRSVRVMTHLIAHQNKPPLAWLYVAHENHDHNLTAAEKELLTRVIDVLKHLLIQHRWLTQ